MSGLFASDEPQQQAPSATQQRADFLAQQEQDRSERDRISTIQKQLQLETLSRGRGYGIRSLFSGLTGGSRTSLLGSG
jgi:hypothetical protein